MKFLKVTMLMASAVFLLSACHSSKKTSYVRHFHKELKGEIDNATVRLKGDTVRVIYPELAMFDFNEATIKASAQPSLKRFAKLLSKYDRINFVINGYTDNVGTKDVNQELSLKRAENAQQLFLSNGVDASRMQAHSMGESHPVMTNDTKEGRQANRRVEFLLYERK